MNETLTGFRLFAYTAVLAGGVLLAACTGSLSLIRPAAAQAAPAERVSGVRMEQRAAAPVQPVDGGICLN